jgi:hypothetical protein
MSQHEATDAGRSREAQPSTADEVDESARTVEREQAHTRPSDDDAGVNPRRQQGSDAGPGHDADAPGTAP